MNSDRIKILFIPPSATPVPSVRGGAVTTRITDIMQNNEEYQQMDITVISRYDELAVTESKKFRYSKVIYITVDNNQEKKYVNSFGIRLINKVGFKMRGRSFISPPYVKKIMKTIKYENYDFVLVAGGDPSFYGALTSKYGKKKMIFYVCGHLLGGKIVAQNYGTFFCCSEYIANFLKRSSVINKESVKAILDCIDTKLFLQRESSEALDDIRKEYGLDSTKKVILFMGRISPEKGIKELLLAFKEMKNRESCQLLIVGDGNFGYGGDNPFGIELRKMCDKMGGEGDFYWIYSS